MSDFSQTRDIMDQKTIKDFSLIVQTPDRLKLLLNSDNCRHNRCWPRCLECLQGAAP